MSLSRLRIQNFQKHEDLDIELDPLITVLVGPSDAGKSSALRALRWICLNQPRGANFKRRQAPKDQPVRLRLKADDKVVRRERNGTLNEYAIGKDKVFRAFSNDVPEDIASLLNVAPINFQRQGEPWFWISLTPPELARQLNKIVDLECIDKVTAKIESKKRFLKTEAEIVEGRLQAAKSVVAETSYAVLMDLDLAKVEAANLRAVELAKNVSSFDVLVEQVRAGEVYVNVLRQRVVLGKKVVETGAKAGKLQSQIDTIQNLLSTIETETDIVSASIPDISSLEALKVRCVETKTQLESFIKLLDQIRDQNDLVKRTLRAKTEAVEALETETDGACPICGGNLKSR